MYPRRKIKLTTQGVLSLFSFYCLIVIPAPYCILPQSAYFVALYWFNGSTITETTSFCLPPSHVSPINLSCSWYQYRLFGPFVSCEAQKINLSVVLTSRHSQAANVSFKFGFNIEGRNKGLNKPGTFFYFSNIIKNVTVCFKQNSSFKE